MDKFTYEPVGVCSKFFEVEIENNIIKRLNVYGGCSGNLQGISSLCVGLDVNEVISRLKGIDCGGRGTSCPDQIANCLAAYLKEKASKQSQTV